MVRYSSVRERGAASRVGGGCRRCDLSRAPERQVTLGRRTEI